ncbi:oxalurate catabolism protein HpxZ [Pseudomonas sp. GD03842]|uniref:oxalurate catabolism protein HpxZ n=1 Tax=Pseudomonas sp. GD03842 TaxID=2975385 RepID=UPI002448D02C|nr:oxalurate catabolism protein HpxZ [Pseudomonas sp. GD03842]MDH0745169.1 oxalurate catabolism protein HpxZ [Pseudomonas sp. GD03842]
MTAEPTSTLNDQALASALARLYAVRPVWHAVRSAREAVQLEAMTLLHAGPPFADPRRPSAPVLSSAVLCCLYEGWATDESEAQRLIADGTVSLRSSQAYRVVTPLAAVISPSTSLVEVSDTARPGGPRCWSLLGSGAGPQIRFGSRAPEILQRMAWRDDYLAPVLRTALEKADIDLMQAARVGLQAGDDLHSRTTAATAHLRSVLSASMDDSVVDAMLAATPLFFLTLWMAACYLMLDATAAADEAHSTRLVVALAGNGIEAGVRLADRPKQWITAPAHVPQGPRLGDGDSAVSPMLGDSGVIDAAGFGAQAWFCKPEAATDIAGWLPAQSPQRPAWLVGSHPDFSAFGLGCAIDANRVSDALPTPLVSIAMLDAAGEKGLLGRGVCKTDPALFGVPPNDALAVNQPQSLAELNRAFERYERALTGNDIEVLDALFWNSPHTLRYGAKEHLYGFEAIRAFRVARPAANLDRKILERSVTSFGSDFGITHMVFSRQGEARLGRQTQSWVRIEGAWRVVAAHVSWMDL